MAPTTETDITLVHDANGVPVVHFDRFFPQSRDRVWEALTDEAQLAVWYPTEVHLQLVAGGLITFAFPGSEPFPGRVLAVEAPRRLVFTTRDDVLTWELSVAGGGCRLTLDNAVADPAHAPYTAAGFHVNFDQLGVLLAQGASAVKRREMPPPDDLVAYYSRVFARSD